MTTPTLDQLLQHTSVLRAIARELVGDSTADDVLQDTAIQTMTAPPQRDGPALGWLARVVRNLASKRLRAEHTRRRHETAAMQEVSAPSDRSAEDSDTLRYLTELVTSLPEPYRATILARYMREQTPSEIAAATATPVRTVKTRLQRGLSLLRERLESHDRDWRTLLIGAFALDPNPTAIPRPIRPTIMKLAILAAVVTPIVLALRGADPITENTARPASASERAAPQPAVRTDAADTAEPVPTDPPPPLETEWAREIRRTPDNPPLMRLDFVGPAAFRSAFAPTKVGELLASTEGKELWQPLLAPVERIWRAWDGRDEDFTQVRSRVLDYAGDIRVLWFLEPGTDHEPDRAFGIFAMNTDGKTDLGALAGDLSRVLQRIDPREPSEAEFDEQKLQIRGEGPSGFVTTPVVLENSVIALFGRTKSLERAMRRGIAALAATSANDTDAPLRFEVDLSRLRELADFRNTPTARRLLGLDSLRRLQVELRPDAGHAKFEASVSFSSGDRGVFKALMPNVETLPRCLARVPEKATPWLALPFRPAEIFRAVLAAESADKPEGERESMRESTREDLGLHLDRELLDHLEGEIMVLGDLWQDRDRAAFRAGEDPPIGACIAMPVRDERAFRAGFEKFLTRLKGIVHQNETRNVNGVKITRLGTAFVTGMHLAIGRGLVAVGFGSEGVAQLESLVARANAPQAQSRTQQIARITPLAPAGWNGVGIADLRALLNGQITLVLEALDDALPRQVGFDPDVDETQAVLDRIAPLIERHELHQLVVTTGYDEGNWRLRVLW